MQSCQGPVMAAVWGLTAATVLQVFQKCGMVKEDDEGRKRVKIYRDKEGRQKGDGLVTYLKEPSVSCDVHEASGGWTPVVQRPMLTASVAPGCVCLAITLNMPSTTRLS